MKTSSDDPTVESLALPAAEPLPTAEALTEIAQRVAHARHHASPAVQDRANLFAALRHMAQLLAESGLTSGSRSRGRPMKNGSANRATEVRQIRELFNWVERSAKEGSAYEAPKEPETGSAAPSSGAEAVIARLAVAVHSNGSVKVEMSTVNGSKSP